MNFREKGSPASLILLFGLLFTSVHGLSSHTRAWPVRRQVAPPLPEAPDSFPPMTMTNQSPAPINALATAAATSTPASTTALAVTTAQESLPPTATTSAASITHDALIQITALPPAPSGSSTQHKRPPKPFNPQFLAPLFAALGVALGAFTAWLLLVCRSRHQTRTRADSLEPGPEYTAPAGANHDVAVKSTMRTNPWSAFLGGRPRSQWGNTADSNQGWLSRILTTRGRPVNRTRQGVPQSTSAFESYSFLNEEDDPFLSTTTGSMSRATASDSVGRTHRQLTTSFLSVGIPPTEDEEWDEVLDNSMHHESRNSLAAVGPKSRRGHTRVDSDTNVLDQRLLSANLPVSCPAERTQSTASGTTAVSSQGSSTGDSKVGFKIVDEDPEEDSTSQRAGWGWNMPWVTAERVSTDDKFTVLPTRNMAEKRKGPTSPALVERVDGVRPTSLPRVHSSVLPASPPLIHSPPLEAKLFFNPVFGSTPSLSLALEANSEGNRRSIQGPKSDYTPTRLPFPGADIQKSNPYRRRLTKSPPNHAVAPSSPHALARSPTSASIASSGSRKVALCKVNQIVARSWSQREMAGVTAPTSPTMFGAVAEADEVVIGGVQSPEVLMNGIEERLAQM
ncbi:hypothetical protein BXZ70DRAFT_510769 [Cristinia sonorae]|uniref:Uncharacterized protein n=1 Tax=Cristinia sonorae TaxID=1940300 RepID=A0A8K0UWE7_9AGAR|nr:hypothetical protein BXZ70DRAFT_510769 [Cristinia sonorae]